MYARFMPLMILLAVFLAACGSAAEPRPTFEPTNTALFRAENIQEDEEALAEVTEEAHMDATEEAHAHADATEEAKAEPTEEVQAEPTEEVQAEPTEEAQAEPTEEVQAEPTEEVQAEATAEAVIEEVVYNGFVGDAEFGKIVFEGALTVFYQNVDRSCASCHEVNEPKPGSGPYLYGIGRVANEHAQEGQTAVDYLVQSILEPGAVIAPSQTAEDGTVYNWDDGVMPTNWNTVLDDQTIADLVAYLMTLTQEGGHDHAH